MRVGKPGSESYRKYHRRLAQRASRQLRSKIAGLCERLDSLVEKAESLGKSSLTRARLTEKAEGVREQLRLIDH